MHVLVTGAGGFLGRYLVRLLVARGDRVRTFAHGQYDEFKALGVESVRGDVRHANAVADACKDVDCVFHAAGVAGIWGPWRHFYGINTAGTRNVVDACVTHGVGRLVYTSSPSVTFDGGEQEGLDESAPYPRRWLCHYPHSKALAEQLVLEANGRERLFTCALRPHLIWGPGDRHLIPRLIQRARSGRLYRVGDGTNRVDMIYVENAADAHLQAADALTPGSPVCGSSYFISQGQPVNCWNWINQILRLAGLPPVERSVSFRTAWRVGRVLEAVYWIFRIRSEPRMTRFLAAQLSKSHYFDIRRARRDFGYEPRISTEEGMRRLAATIRDA